MKPNFVETSNYRRFTDALTRLDDRGAEEACMVVVDGKPGLGKTKSMMRWTAQTQLVYLRAQRAWDYGWLMQELLGELSITNVPRGRRDRFELAIERLDDLSTAAAIEIGRAHV